jgi:hypothetical protein
MVALLGYIEKDQLALDVGGLKFCPLLDQSGQRWILAGAGLFANDPSATLAVHCGNSFDAGFSLYQSTRLSR